MAEGRKITDLPVATELTALDQVLMVDVESEAGAKTRRISGDTLKAIMGQEGVRATFPASNINTTDLTLTGADKADYVVIDSPVDRVVTFPNSWLTGDACVIRRQGAGGVSWILESGATAEVPSTRSAHNHINEQFGEIFIRCVRNVGGAAAVWYFTGDSA